MYLLILTTDEMSYEICFISPDVYTGEKDFPTLVCIYDLTTNDIVPL